MMGLAFLGGVVVGGMLVVVVSLAHTRGFDDGEEYD